MKLWLRLVYVPCLHFLEMLPRYVCQRKHSNLTGQWWSRQTCVTRLNESRLSERSLVCELHSTADTSTKKSKDMLVNKVILNLRSDHYSKPLFRMIWSQRVKQRAELSIKYVCVFLHCRRVEINRSVFACGLAKTQLSPRSPTSYDESSLSACIHLHRNLARRNSVTKEERRG